MTIDPSLAAFDDAAEQVIQLNQKLEHAQHQRDSMLEGFIELQHIVDSDLDKDNAQAAWMVEPNAVTQQALNEAVGRRRGLLAAYRKRHNR